MSTITDLTLSTTASDSMGIINENFDNLNADKLEKSGGTMTGQINFSGTTHAGVKLNSLTTTQRDALTPAEGMIIYNSTTSQVEVYQGGAWVSSSSGVSDATETVKGIGEIATQAEIEAGTELGGTGASLIVNPKNLKSSVYYTGLPSSDEKAALAGTSGTPSGTNKFVTNADTSSTPTGTNIIRATGGKLNTTYIDGTLTNGTNADSLHKHTIGGLSLVNTGQATQAKDTTGTQNIAHGLGATPSLIIIQAYALTSDDAVAEESSSYGTAKSTSTETCSWRYNRAGSSQNAGQDATHIIYLGNNHASATLSGLDATNITLDWDVNANAGGTRYIQWVAFL